jgi:hypothetical protein
VAAGRGHGGQASCACDNDCEMREGGEGNGVWERSGVTLRAAHDVVICPIHFSELFLLGQR